MTKPTRPVTEGKENVITFNVIGSQGTIKAKHERVLKMYKKTEAKVK
jgi:RNase P/RNase MRP subunit POP5